MQRTKILLVGTAAIGLAVIFSLADATPTASSQGNIRAFEVAGSQPGEWVDYLQSGQACAICHGNYDQDLEPYATWQASMMAQSSRDPIFFAALAIAEQDLEGSGFLCMRCHMPGAHMEGRTIPSDGSGLDPFTNDFDGVNCHFCHRMVDPVLSPDNPSEDAGILAGLSRPLNVEPHSGMFVLDPQDRRRGPFDLGPTFPFHEFRESPFHRESMLCGTCHDVSNPAMVKRDSGIGYRLSNLNMAHPTMDKEDMFPLERTFGEWTKSVYAVAPIDTGGRFGGNQPEVQSCQDCHMPTTDATACAPGLGGVFRPDMPRHFFNGANSWVLKAVRSIYPDYETGLSDSLVLDASQRTLEMMQSAAQMETFERDGSLVVRVINLTGHRLPTGYGEGRRMWVQVQFFDVGDQLVSEHGAYDPVAADLDTASTKVYEIHHGLDAYMANQTGKPAGPGFHFALNNTVLLDNRIPARGFTNAAYEAIDADVVAYSYEDQQHWDETTFRLPTGAVRAEVSLFHQTTTREYIEFLRDENQTNTTGQDAYDLWELFGKSAPVEMASSSLDFNVGACATPIPYGLGSLNSLDQRATLHALNAPNLPVLNLQLTGAIPGQMALLWEGTGTASVPHLGGVLLISGPYTRRGTALTDPQGKASFSLPVDATMVGTSRSLQVIYRDPASAAGASLSQGLYVTFCN